MNANPETDLFGEAIAEAQPVVVGPPSMFLFQIKRSTIASFHIQGPPGMDATELYDSFNDDPEKFMDLANIDEDEFDEMDIEYEAEMCFKIEAIDPKRFTIIEVDEQGNPTAT